VPSDSSLLLAGPKSPAVLIALALWLAPPAGPLTTASGGLRGACYASSPRMQDPVTTFWCYAPRSRSARGKGCPSPGQARRGEARRGKLRLTAFGPPAVAWCKL